MPLVITIVFFSVLFFCEGCYYMNKNAHLADERRRYQLIEHPRHNTSDEYLDNMQ